jgi:hypothetical protein
MTTVQVWLTELDMERLRIIREYIVRAENPDIISEELVGQYVRGDMSIIIRGSKVNNSFIIRRAIKEMAFTAESYLEEEAKKREAAANGPISGPTSTEERWR